MERIDFIRSLFVGAAIAPSVLAYSPNITEDITKAAKKSKVKVKVVDLSCERVDFDWNYDRVPFTRNIPSDGKLYRLQDDSIDNIESGKAKVYGMDYSDLKTIERIMNTGRPCSFSVKSKDGWAHEFTGVISYYQYTSGRGLVADIILTSRPDFLS